MSARRTVILLIVSGGLCAALLSLGLNLASSEIIDWLRKQAWYTTSRLWTAVVMVALAGIAIAVRQFGAISEDELSRSFFAAERLKRKRQRMVARVRHDWIDGVLNQSLYQMARIDLGLVVRSDVVDIPLTLVVQELAKPPQPLPANTRISDIFDEKAGGLLILGSAGAGKTTLLLELARELLNRADADDTHPIPVVFNLSTWRRRHSSLTDWMVEELSSPMYEVSKKLARYWVTNEQILPLLDGLDEVADEHREACAEAINN
jgi:hypothetical protein